MQLEQRFTLPHPPVAAWPMFKNIELLVGCLPGASLTGPAVDGDVPLRFDVKLGPIAAGFVGEGQVSFDDAGQAGRFVGQATDKRTNSRVKGSAAFALQPDAAGTRVDVTVEYALTGSLAQFSRGAIVRELASALTAQFAANLSDRLRTAIASGHASPAAASTPASPSTFTSASASPFPPSSAPQALDGWSLVKQMLRQRWARWRIALAAAWRR